MTEEAVLFGGGPRSLAGILTSPSTSRGRDERPAVLLLNAGIVHRVGPNRLYVKLARALADLGFSSLRFDFSGVGDSKVREDNLPFEKSAVSETQEAMDWLGATRGVDRFVLIGLCSGAHVSLQAATSDKRVVGAALMNAPDYLEDVREYFRRRADARYYSHSAVFNARSWLRLMTGASRYRNILAVTAAQVGRLLWRQAHTPPRSTAMTLDLQALAERGIRLLLVYNEWESGLEQLRGSAVDGGPWFGPPGAMRVEIIARTDHLFTSRLSQQRVIELVEDWAQTIA